MPSRLVKFAGNAVAVDFDSPEAQQLVDFLFRDLNDQGDQPLARLRIRTDPAPSAGWSLWRDDQRIYHGSCRATLANLLVGETIHVLIAHARGGVALHAAALSRDGRAVLMPGRSGAGKSTLTMWLTRRGFNYLTDEAVFLAGETDRVEAFTRPLHIKRGALPAVTREFDVDSHASETLSSAYVTIIPHRLLNPNSQLDRPRLQVIVFPHYLPGGELEIERLSKARTGLGLMDSLVNARNLPGHGFAEAARIARGVAAYRLSYSSFDQLGESLDRILP